MKTENIFINKSKIYAVQTTIFILTLNYRDYTNHTKLGIIIQLLIGRHFNF